MNIKYKIILWDPEGKLESIESKVCTAGAGGRAEIYNRVRNAVAFASMPAGDFNFFHLEDDMGSEIYVGRKMMQRYVAVIRWL